MSLLLGKRQFFPAALMSAVILACSPVLALEPAGDAPALTKEQAIANGQKLAKDKCASCHSIEKQGNSPHKDAPPFRSFADKWPLSSLEESLAEGIVTGHADMPEAVLTPTQIDAFLEFLGSLQKQ